MLSEEDIVLEMKKGSISLTLLTCHVCHVSFGLFSYVLQVDKMHNPPHLIQVHVLSTWHMDKSDGSLRLCFLNYCMQPSA